VIFIVLFIIELSYYTFNGCFCPASACAAEQMRQTTARMQNISVDIEQCNTCYSLPWEQCQCNTHCGKPDTITSIMIAIYRPLFIIGILIVTYLFSCFVIWIYDKFRKKKK